MEVNIPVLNEEVIGTTSVEDDRASTDVVVIRNLKRRVAMISVEAAAAAALEAPERVFAAGSVEDWAVGTDGMLSVEDPESPERWLPVMERARDRCTGSSPDRMERKWDPNW